MHTLFVSREVPDANGGGSQRRAAQHLDVLRRLGDVTLVLPMGERHHADKISLQLATCELKSIIFRTDRTVSAVSRAAYAGTSGKVARFFNALRLAPFLDERPMAGEEVALGQLTDSYDILFAFRLDSAIWADHALPLSQWPSVKIVDFDDIESRSFNDIILKSGGTSLVWSVLLRRHLAWLRATERRIAQRWTSTTLCSALDAGRFVAATGVRPAIVPNAADFGPVIPEVSGATTCLLFVGTFGYLPNADGFRWFVNGVWPKLRAAWGRLSPSTWWDRNRRRTSLR